MLRLFAAAEEPFLGVTATQAEAAKLPCVELRTCLGGALAHTVRQGEVHVVAAEQDVVADRDPIEDELAAFLAHGDQAEVGGAAADVADQHDVADVHFLAPGVAVRIDPGVERRLRLFQDGDLWQAGIASGLQRQVAGDGVEGCRHGEQDVLLFERRVGERGVPCVAHVREVLCRRRHRRQLRHVIRTAPRQDGRGAIGAGMRQPRLGRRDQPGGNLRPTLPCELSDDEVGCAGPRQRQRIRR